MKGFGLVYDLTVHRKNIKRNAIRQLDFAAHSYLEAHDKMEELLIKCERVSDIGFKNLTLSKAVLRGKKVYKVKSFEHELVLRLIIKNLKRLTGARQTNRNSIVKSLKMLLQEGIDYNVFKFDVKSFYESVDIKELIAELENDQGFSRSHVKLIKSFFAELDNQNINGLPRGLAISATLAEYVMRKFDRALTDRDSIYFYERFVDDIIIVTSPVETKKGISKFLCKKLPYGLTLNSSKTRSVFFAEAALKKSQNSAVHDQVDFLGYTFKVFQRQKSDVEPIARQVHVDISLSKTKKIKTKLVKACMQYCSDGDFQKLQYRVKLLSGNYTIFDHGRGIRRKAGIFFNYSVVDPDNSQSLKELDVFLQKLFLSNKGNLCSQLHVKLSNSQRRAILKHSFLHGFTNRVFYNFSGRQLVDLMRCWTYG